MTDWSHMDWDGWRKQRATMSDDEHRQFARTASIFYPEQKCFDINAVEEFFLVVPPHAKVVEVGGYDGELAAKILAKIPDIASWANVEFLPIKTVCTDPRYHAVIPPAYRWWDKHPNFAAYNVLVASHVFEHLLGSEIETILGLAKSVKYLYIDCPVPRGGQDWKGYAGTHCIDIGWDALDVMVRGHGFTCIGGTKTATWYMVIP